MGEPGSRVPLGPPEVTEGDIEAVVRVLRTTRLSRGEAAREFERGVARAVGVEHALAVNSGTSGLHVALRALGIGAGDEVVTTPYSFVASANVLLYEDAVPVFCDVDPVDLNLDPERVEAAITGRTRGILPVHVYGRPVDMGPLREIARRHGLVLLEDACEALGSERDGVRAGAMGDVGVLSFYPNKQITTGEGGVVTTDSAELHCRMVALRNQGRVPTATGGFDQEELGFSYRLPEMSCALGASQLERLQAVVERRAEIAAAYDRRLREVAELVLPELEVPNGRISWFAYVVRLAPELPAGLRDEVIARMEAADIESRPYFLPIHLQPLYRRRFGYRGGEFPNAERAGRRCIALPFFNRITPAQIDRVCRALVTAIRDR